MENKIRVLHISSSDIMGGASRAAYRLNKALRKIDVESKMLVNNKISSDDDILSAFNYKKKLFKIFRYTKNITNTPNKIRQN